MACTAFVRYGRAIGGRPCTVSILQVSKKVLRLGFLLGCRASSRQAALLHFCLDAIADPCYSAATQLLAWVVAFAMELIYIYQFRATFAYCGYGWFYGGLQLALLPCGV